ncbi:pupal cuticle protein C1B-like [Periplaneta americana]|uniref:pupal cuticle protein C1B-like n=1 Tax=Periplaneta americana TaxID=6978 RepID=UPI0037E7DD1D
MAFKYVILAALVAVANAGFLSAPAVGYAGYAAPAVGYAGYAGYAAPPAIGASHQSTVRSLDGNSAVSHYSKAVDSPFSSVRKYDTRISNDAVALAHAPVAAYAAPVAHAAYAAPVAHAAYAPAFHGAAYAAPAVAAPLGVAYSAAPAVAHLAFDGFGAHYGY